MFLFYQPTLDEFLSFDKTNEIPYSEDFKCVEFSERLVANAQRFGIESEVVYVFFRNEGGMVFHAIVYFPEYDVYIEPQSDDYYYIESNMLCAKAGCYGEIVYLSN